MPDFWTFLLSLTAGERDENGNFVLRRALTPAERDQLQTRARQLAPWLQPARRVEIAEAVRAMALGFGASGTVNDAKAIAGQYVEALSDLPAWAIIRACQRFRDGTVTAAELGQRSIDHSFRPTTAQLRKVAIELVRPFGEESTRIFMTIRGTTERVAGPEERERVAKGFAEFQQRMRASVESNRLDARRQAMERLAETDPQNRSAILEQYQAAGVAPVKDGAGNLVSLALLLRSGWRIEDTPIGERVLVRPPQQEPGAAYPMTRMAIDRAESIGSVADDIMGRLK